MRLSLRLFSIFSLYLVSLFSISAAVDYSRCQAFVSLSNNYKSGPGILGGSSAVFGFRIKDDGSIQKEDYADIKTADGGKTQIITYEVPGAFSFASGTEVKSESIKVEYTIRRDDKGRIVEIYDGANATTAQLERLQKQQQDYYRENTPEEIRKRNDEVFGGEDKKYEPPFRSYKGRSIKFDFKGDKCIPSSVANESYMEPKADGKTMTNTQMDIDLCRDVNEFLEANPEASACFRKDINDRMGMIFRKHAPKFTREAESITEFSLKSGGMGSYGGFGGVGSLGTLAFTSPAMLVLGSDERFLQGLDNQNYMEIKRRLGNTPIINGQRLLQSCFDNGVREIIEDDSLWSVGRSTNQSRTNQDSVQRR